MDEYFVPVDLFNPGQVFACLGFLEAADILLGDAEGGFDWTDEPNVRFLLRAAGDKNPFGVVLDFLAPAEVEECRPDSSGTFPAPEPDRMALPIRLVRNLDGRRCSLDTGHWSDASSRDSFKLYAGNRSAKQIAQAMLDRVKTLWAESRDDLITRPFDVLTSLGGSFNFDPRGAFTGIDAGYSPDAQGHRLAASPVVELLAAIGLEHARPAEYDTRQVRYAAWGVTVPPVLARPVLAAGRLAVPMRMFSFTLSGKYNKIVTFAQEEAES